MDTRVIRGLESAGVAKLQGSRSAGWLSLLSQRPVSNEVDMLPHGALTDGFSARQN
jgi:hypothetical protein